MDEEVRRGLRGAGFRQDAAEIMRLLDPELVREFPQIAGEALLVALVHDAPGAATLASECAATLMRREWDGDAELALQLHAGSGPAVTRALTPVPVELEQLADALRGGEHQVGARLNIRTGEVVQELGYADLLSSGLLDDEEEADEEDEVWLYVDAVGSREGYRDMERFIDDRVPRVVATSLIEAITGKGAFARFRARIAEWPELAESWRRYSEERWLGRARAWLADAGYRPTTNRRS